MSCAECSDRLQDMNMKLDVQACARVRHLLELHH